MLLSRGLEISDVQAIKVWGTIVQLAPWVASANLFSWDTWDRVQTLARQQEVKHGEEPPLGFCLTISALKLCFPRSEEHVTDTGTPNSKSEKQWEKFDDKRVMSDQNTAKETVGNRL